MSSEPTATTGTRSEATLLSPGEVKVVPKPWGEERWLVQNDHYAAKVLIVKRGHRLSLQFHEHKHETQYVHRGRVRYTLGNSERPAKYREAVAEAGTVIVLPPGAVHRMEALEDSEIFEVSTPELDDVVRLDDDYGRTGTSAP